MSEWAQAALAELLAQLDADEWPLAVCVTTRDLSGCIVAHTLNRDHDGVVKLVVSDLGKFMTEVDRLRGVLADAGEVHGTSHVMGVVLPDDGERLQHPDEP